MKKRSLGGWVEFLIVNTLLLAIMFIFLQLVAGLLISLATAAFTTLQGFVALVLLLGIIAYKHKDRFIKEKA